MQSEAPKDKEAIRAERQKKKNAKKQAKVEKSGGNEPTKPVQAPTPSRAPAAAPHPQKPEVKKEPEPVVKVTPEKSAKKPSTEPVPSTIATTTHHKMKLFNHLYRKTGPRRNAEVNSTRIHPAIVRLGVQLGSWKVVGSNARCIAFLRAIRTTIFEFSAAKSKEYVRELEAMIEACIAYTRQQRPISVSIQNSVRSLKWQINQLATDSAVASDTEKRDCLMDAIDTYIRDQIDKADTAISLQVQKKITEGDCILVYGCSSLVRQILEKAHQEGGRRFRVIVVDAEPRKEGQEMVKRLTKAGIECTLVLISAIAFVMPTVSKVFLGVHALLANGYVMSRIGTAQIALVARAFNVPVIVCCEIHKFSEKVQTDSFVYNEIGDSPMLKSDAYNTLDLCYDVTPPEHVTAVVTENAILPCTSVPVILRIKPNENIF